MADRVAVYARVSSERQEREDTIASQIAQLRERAQKQGYVIIQEYLDDGFSGELVARPALDRMRDDAGRGQFERILILSPDRLSRRWAYGEVITDELKRHGIVIEYMNQKNDETDEGRLLLGITGLFAEYEKAKILERSRRGRLHRVKSGFIVTSHAPYGYRYVPRTGERRGELVIDPAEAQVVRLIFSLCVDQGMSVRGIVRELFHRGITPRGRQGPKAYWAKSSLRKVLGNETVCGTWHFQKYYSAIPDRRRTVYQRSLKSSRRLRSRSEWIPVTGIAAIINRETFERAQIQIKKNTVFSPRNAHHQYLLRGLCRCGLCGLTYQGIPSHGKFYYRCNNKRIHSPAPSTCRNASLRADRLEPAVWLAIRGAMQNPDVIIGFIPEALRLDVQEQSRRQAERDAVCRELARLDTAENRLLDVFSQGILTAEQLRDQMQKIRDKKKHLEQDQSPPEAIRADPSVLVPSIVEFCREVARGLDILESDIEKRQHFLRDVVDEIRIFPGEAVIKGAIRLGGIAALQAGRCGRNSTWSFELKVAV